MASPDLLRQVRLTDEEERLARIDPGYERASTASRLDAFILPDSLEFAEYNAESPAGLAYAENLAEVFDGLEIMRAVPRAVPGALLPADRGDARRAHRELPRVGRPGQSPPTVLITDFRGVPTWSEFEILQAAVRGARRADRDRRSARPRARGRRAARGRAAARSISSIGAC